MTEFQKIAVIGSGVMGSGIAALCANAGLDVVLLDIVPEGAENRNALSQGAIAKQLKSKMPGFTHKKNAKKVTCGNLEDDLNLLGEADWIIEVVLEKLEVKHDVYKKIDSVRKKGAIVSSNTSTLPLHTLIEGQSEDFAAHFMITHFFNPPRFMPLLEVVKSPKMKAATYEALQHFADVRLGKTVVECKDTPGFLANRIGVYWLMVGLLDAIEMGITVEEADAIMGRPMGIPKTAVFGLFDLIGIDLMPLIAKAMLDSLPESDVFRKIYNEPDLVKNMIAEGYTGRKGKGGFYKLDEKRNKLAKNLQTGEYAPATKPRLASVAAGRAGLAAVFGTDDIGGKYAKSVMLKVLHYAASLLPEISDDIISVDAAMRTGYAWKYGPFELIDKLAWDGATGTQVFMKACADAGLEVPEIITKANGQPLYRIEEGVREAMGLDGAYHAVPIPEGSLMLEDVQLTSKPVLKNGSAKAWDLGDGVLGFELTTKMNTFDPGVFELLHKAMDLIESGDTYKGLVIAADEDKFSLGANLGFFMFAANTASWWVISDMIKQGQSTFMRMKYADFPVVGSLSGMALGGGCELLLHCDAVQAHIESYPGLVELGVGIIPGWGGCKEMVLRHQTLAEDVKKDVLSGKRPRALMPQGPMPAIAKAFEYISTAKVGGSAHEAQEMQILRECCGITMNRRRVLADAKAKCLSLADGYQAPERLPVRVPGPTGRAALEMALDGFVSNGKATAHDEVICRKLAAVLTGGETDITEEIDEQVLLDLEHDYFMELVGTQGTLDRIAHMLETNKPLRN